MWVEAAAHAATESTAAIVVVAACIRSAPALLHRRAIGPRSIAGPLHRRAIGPRSIAGPLHNSVLRCREFNQNARDHLERGVWNFWFEHHFTDKKGAAKTTWYWIDLRRALKRTSALQGRQAGRYADRGLQVGRKAGG